mmetsp:Transcript_20389/g.48544  ORF Transcript_20389/g.48544 Transcript_20389/m.48544 type:complete len:385 (-) Transcript_20389:90-1244(-)
MAFPNLVVKSRKRRAAEAALTARIASSQRGLSKYRRTVTKQENSDCSEHETFTRDTVSVEACTACHGRCAWSSIRLSVPHVEFASFPREAASSSARNTSECSTSDRNPTYGFPRASYSGSLTNTEINSVIFGICRVVVVETETDVPRALNWLRESMRDSVVAIDLEWRPDCRLFNKNRVALLQLATSSSCLLIRTCKLGFELAPELQDFLSDPRICFVGFSWDVADNSKMKYSFCWGVENFARLVDLQVVAKDLGYGSRCGLGELAKQVLGLSLLKNDKVTRSNWEARQLSDDQVEYAAADAFLTGHLLRCLGLWHSSPSPCPVCKGLLGLPVVPPPLRCPAESCGRCFPTPEAMHHHSLAKDHPAAVLPCGLCGRWTAAVSGA